MVLGVGKDPALIRKPAAHVHYHMRVHGCSHRLLALPSFSCLPPHLLPSYSNFSLISVPLYALWLHNQRQPPFQPSFHFHQTLSSFIAGTSAFFFLLSSHELSAAYSQINDLLFFLFVCFNLCNVGIFLIIWSLGLLWHPKQAKQLPLPTAKPCACHF